MIPDKFHFDFDENIEPVEELHRLRLARTKHFKTIEAIVEYDRTMPTAKEMIAILKGELAKKKSVTTCSRNAKSGKKHFERQRNPKHLTHP